MRSMLVVVPDVVGEHPLQVRPTEDEEPVEALPSDGAHPPLGIGVGHRRPDRDLEDLDALAGEHCLEGGHELGVPIADQEAKAAIGESRR